MTTAAVEPDSIDQALAGALPIVRSALEYKEQRVFAKTVMMWNVAVETGGKKAGEAYYKGLNELQRTMLSKLGRAIDATGEFPREMQAFREAGLL